MRYISGVNIKLIDDMSTEVSVRQSGDIVAPQRIEDLLEAFISSQDVRKSSKDLYRRELKQYFTWVDSKGYLLSEIARPQLLEYKEELLSSGLSPLTVGGYITAVRRFYEWAEALKYYPNVARGIKNPRRKQQFMKQPLTALQATDLLTYLQGENLRDFAMINLMIRTGLRCIEISRANTEDMTCKGGQRVLQVQGKGRDGKNDFVILTEKTAKPLDELLMDRKAKPGEPLFISTSNNNQGERISTRTISYIAKEGLRAIGLNEKAYTAHSLRHSAGTNILRAGGSLEQVRQMLRHSNIQTSMIYTRTLDEERRLQNSGEALIDNLF